MDFIPTSLTSSEANSIFNRQSCFLTSELLETMLRYIAIKRCGGNLELLKPIRTHHNNFDTPVSFDALAHYLPSAPDSEIKLIICTAYNRRSIIPTAPSAPEWLPLDKPPCPLAPFLSKISPTSIFLKKSEHIALVFVRDATHEWLKAFCASIFRIFQWLYPPEKPLGEEELTLSKCIQNDDRTQFKAIIDAVCPDLKIYFLKNLLVGWNNCSYKSRVKKLSDQRTNIENEISSYVSSLNRKYAELDNLVATLNAVLTTCTEDDDALYKFFASHKQINAFRVENIPDGKQLSYRILETIEYFDKDIFLTCWKNKSSYLYKNSYYSKEQGKIIRDIMYAIFVEDRGVIRTESVFTLTNYTSISPLRGTTGKNTAIALPHPHIAQHTCLGDNRQYIDQYLRNGNWDMAIEQTIAAAKNINFSDNSVVVGFMYDIASNMNTRCVIADNGKEMTFNEFLKYIGKAPQEETDNVQTASA